MRLVTMVTVLLPTVELNIFTTSRTAEASTMPNKAGLDLQISCLRPVLEQGTRIKLDALMPIGDTYEG